jgi:hypothetical protein
MSTGGIATPRGKDEIDSASSSTSPAQTNEIKKGAQGSLFYFIGGPEAIV